MVVLVPWSVYPDKRKIEGGVAVFVVVRLGGFYEEEGITKRRRAAAQGHFLPHCVSIASTLSNVLSPSSSTRVHCRY